jgi:hypothetical protein
MQIEGLNYDLSREVELLKDENESIMLELKN